MNRTATITACAMLLLGGLIGYAVKTNIDGFITPNDKVPPAKAGEPAKEDSFKQPAGYSLTPEMIDLGTLQEGQGLEKAIVLKHPGKGEARIGRIYSTCPCVNASAPKMIIPATEEGEIKINYHSLTANGMKTVYYYVELLKPEKITLRGTVKSNVKRVPSLIMLEPSVLHFGSVNGTKEQTVKLWNLTKRSIRVTLEDAAGLNVSDMDKAKTVLPGKFIEIKAVADSGSLKAGSLNGKLRLTTSLDLHKEVVIPFDGSVRKN